MWCARPDRTGCIHPSTGQICYGCGKAKGQLFCALDLTRRTETTAVATKFTRYGRCGDVDGARPVTAVMGRLRHFGGRIVLLGEKLYLQSFGCYREAKPAMNF